MRGGGDPNNYPSLVDDFVEDENSFVRRPIRELRRGVVWEVEGGEGELNSCALSELRGLTMTVFLLR